MKSATRSCGLIAVALLVAACAAEREATCPCPEAGRAALPEELMLTLSSARSLHHQADLLLQSGEVERAISVVRAILALKLESRWPEAEEVRLDATARLGKLLLGKGDEKSALEVVERELATGARESFYLSNLHSVRGEILEARAKRLDAAGEKEPGRQSAREAIGAFERSIQINKRLQQQLLERGRR
jgi:hypothetical protein